MLQIYKQRKIVANKKIDVPSKESSKYCHVLCLGRIFQTKREQAILEHFGESKLGKSATRQERMTLHRQFD